MAETKEELIIEINVEGATGQLAGLRQELDKLIDMRQELNEKSKQGDLEATKDLEKLNSVIRNTQTEYKAQQRVLDGYTNSIKSNADKQNFANNSIQTNRDLLKQLTAQYIQLKNPSQQATDTIKKLSDTLKQQEGVIGDTRRNVGNYFNEFAKGVPVLGTIIDPLKNIGGAFQNVGVNAAGFQAAFLAGIPLIIAGVQGLISIMQKFDSVTEGLEDTMMGVNQAFDFFVSHGNDGSLTDLVNGMTDAYDAGVKLSQVMRELAEAQDRQTVLNAKANKEVEALILQSKDRTKTEQERIRLLDEASSKEKKNLEENLALAKQREQLAGNELRRIIEAGLNDDKAKKELNASARERINIERESNNLQEKILNRRNALLDEIQQNEDKLKQAQAKRTEDEKKQSDARIAQAQKEADTKLAIERKHNEDVSNLQIEFTLTDRQRLEDSFAAKQALLDANNADELALINTIETEKQRALQKYDDDRIAQNAKTLSTITAQYSTSAKEQTEIEKKAADEKIAIKQAELSFASTISKGLIGLISNVAEATGASAAFSKVLALVEIGTQTAIALATGIASSQDLPYPANLVAMGSTIAAVLGAIGSAIGILSKTPDAPKPSFATGVIGLDGEGTETSDSIDARLSKGESVLTAKATRKYHRELAWMEMSVGNKPNYQFGNGMFATGFIPSDGGFVARSIARDSDNALMIQQGILKGFSLVPAPTLSIVEFQSKQDSRNRSVKVSEA